MVSRPEQWINDMADAQVDQYTFHIEPVEDVAAVCRKVREAGMKVGVAIKPNTPVESVDKYIEMADLVLIMTVEPVKLFHQLISSIANFCMVIFIYLTGLRRANIYGRNDD